MSEENKNVVVIDRNDLSAPNMLDDLRCPGNKFLCTIPDDGTRKSKIRIYNAVNGAAEQLADHKNEVLEIVDVVAQALSLPDMQTGELLECLRTVLIAADGKHYQAVSQGVASSLSQIFSIIGMPSWKDDPVKMKAVEEKTKNGYRVMKLVLVE